MSAISKEMFYNGPSSKLSCRTIIHPTTEHCLRCVGEMMLSTVVGSAKFYLLVYIVQTISKRRKIDKNLLKTQLRAYFRSIFYTTIFTLNLVGSLCLVRNILNKFYYYNLAFSGAFAGTTLRLESKENRDINAAIFFNLVVETVLRYIISNVKRPIFKETFLFMVCSANLMYLLETRKNVKIFSFWFYYPQTRNMGIKSKNAATCSHEGLCCNYIYQGFMKYFIVGYTIQLLKYSLPRLGMLLKNPVGLFKAILGKRKLFSGLFFGGYAAIYRLVSCFLSKNAKETRPFHPFCAGFLAGSAYVLKPTLSVLAVALSTTMQLWIQQMHWINNLKFSLPLQEIIFMFCTGFLFHNRFLFPDTTPQQVKNLLSLNTNGRVDMIYKRFVEAANRKLIIPTVS